MKLSDYIQYYIGCEVIIDDKERGLLIGAHLVPNSCNQIYYQIQTEEMRIQDGEDFCMPYNDDPDEPVARIKPILRYLGDMSLEEQVELTDITTKLNEYTSSATIIYAAKINYLLKKGFDLYGLINAGLAVDTKTITP